MDVREFPPLYTLQPVATTRAKQLDVWRGLVLKACEDKALTTVELASFAGFSNERIKRSLDMDGRRAVGDALVGAGLGEWEDATKTRLRVSARTPEAWGALIYEWASQTARIGTVCTVYEIHSGDDAASTELAGLHPELCLKALRALEKLGKVQLFPAQPVDESGVKFL